MRYLRWALIAGTWAAAIACGLAGTVDEVICYGVIATIFALAVIATVHLEFGR